MATIGELIINLNANTASFVTDLNRVKNLSFDTAKQVQRSFSLIGTAALGMVGTFSAAMVGMVDHTVELETHILHLAAASGMSVESMSGLAFAAKMFGLEVDQVASAMEKFDKQLIAAQLGNAKATQNMSLLGIDPASIQTSDQALLQLSAHFAAMPDGILKTGEAMLAFSKNGATMLEFLNQGPVAIQKYLDMARALGVVFDKDDAEAALHFKQNLEILQGAFQGFQIQLETAILPNLTELTNLLVTAQTETVHTAGTIDNLKGGLQVLASILIFSIQQVEVFGSDCREIGEVIGALAVAAVAGFSAIGAAASGNFKEASKALQGMKDSWALAAAAVSDGAARMNAIEIQTGQELNAIWGEGVKGIGLTKAAIASLTAKVGDHQKAVEALKKSIDAIVTSLQTQIATLGMSAAQIQVYKIQTDAAKLGIEGWAQSEIALYLQLQKRLDLLQQFKALDTSKRDEEKKNFLADKLKSDQDDLAAMQAQLDVMMRMAIVPVASLVISTGPSDRFTASIDAQTAALEHQVATFGMSTEAIARYDLAQLDSSDAAQKQIAKFKALEDQLAGMQARAKTMTEAWKQFGDVALRSLDDLIFSGKKFTQVLADITKQLGEMFLKWALFGFGQKNAGGFGGIFGDLFGLISPLMSGAGGIGIDPFDFTGFASGGPVSANVPVMVGEKGPEIFTPKTSGTIIPNGGGAGGQQINISYQIDARGSSITEEQFRRSLSDSENRAVQRAMNAGREMQLRTA
jgi:hypothetical protein